MYFRSYFEFDFRTTVVSDPIQIGCDFALNSTCLHPYFDGELGMGWVGPRINHGMTQPNRKKMLFGLNFAV